VPQSQVLIGVQIKDAVGNDYGRPRDIVGENRYAFTTHADSAFDVCFENIIPDSKILPVTRAAIRGTYLTI